MKRILSLIFLYTICSYAQISLYLEKQIQVPSEKIYTLSFSNDGRFMAYATKNNLIFVMDVNANRYLYQLKKHTKEVTALIFDNNNQYLISGSKDEKIIIWDLYSGSINTIIDNFNDDIYSLSISPDNKTLAGSGDKDDIYLWEFPSGYLKGKLKGHDDDVFYVNFSKNGDQLISIDKEKQMIVWSIGKQKLVRKTTIDPHTFRNSGIDIYSAKTSLDKYFIAIGTEEHVLAKGGRRMIFKHNIAFYKWETGSELEILEDIGKKIKTFAIAPDKNYIITDCSTLQNGKISIWNLHKGVVEKNYPIDGKISVINISADGKWLAVAYQKKNEIKKSIINLWHISGIEAYQRFNTSNKIQIASSSAFGSAIKLTTPKEPLINFGERKRIAVLYFDSPGLEKNIAKTSTYLLEGTLGNSPAIELIERNQIDKVMKELQYQLTGLTDNDAVELGKQLNAEYILLGSINKLGNLLIITTKLINVETAHIEGTRAVQCTNATIEDIANMIYVLAPTISRF